MVADFATLVGTYSRGFAVIFEPHDERYPAIPDPVLQLACLDSSLAMRPVLERFQSVRERGGGRKASSCGGLWGGLQGQGQTL